MPQGKRHLNPNGVVVGLTNTWAQPPWGWFVRTRRTQGSSCLATLGFVAESLQDLGHYPCGISVTDCPEGRGQAGAILNEH